MATIMRVGEVGDMLEVQTDAGHIIMLRIDTLLSKPAFAPLAEDDRILYPHTDGESMYWCHGPRIRLDDMIALLDEPSPANKPPWRAIR